MIPTSIGKHKGTEESERQHVLGESRTTVLATGSQLMFTFELAHNLVSMAWAPFFAISAADSKPIPPTWKGAVRQRPGLAEGTLFFAGRGLWIQDVAK